jgi:hypothetical protein
VTLSAIGTEMRTPRDAASVSDAPVIRASEEGLFDDDPHPTKKAKKSDIAVVYETLQPDARDAEDASSRRKKIANSKLRADAHAHAL